jgi:NADH-quinone oxidoreductase subunit L
VSDEVLLALAALACPLAATLLTPLFGSSRSLARFAHLPAVLGFAAAAGLAVAVLVHVAASPDEHVAFVMDPVPWFSAGLLSANFTITVDPLSSVMLCTVTFIATWIAIFSAGYMRDGHGHPDAGYVRYFAVMSLFVFAMCLLVLANNFLLLVAGWEGVGLCSYLLVGYYHAKPSAAAAARKAFLVTRLGDVGMFLGIFLLWRMGNYHLDLDKLFHYLSEHPPHAGQITAAVLLLFCGAVGKSAQLPLYVWLPDAMEGPTPVSALIHAATMVTAGVYLLARCAPLFVMAAGAQATVALVGAATAFLAAFIAVTQTDLKRVLAYSTVSQLGFMFMALGCGGAVTPTLAVAAAIFHLFTHAFFKALLFLGSGSVMHAMGDVIDMRKFGGLRTVMPVTHATFLCGAAALAGLPVLSGFWSKDAILDVVEGAWEHSPRYGLAYAAVFGLALATAGLTAFYTFRAYFLTFWGPTRVPPEAGDHAHESPRGMTVPLVVLAAGAVFAGLAVEPVNHGFSHFLGRTPAVRQADGTYERKMNIRPDPHPHFSPTIALVSTLLAVGGVAAAYSVYRRGVMPEVPPPLAGVYALSRNKGYVDEVYYGAVVKPAEVLAAGSRQADAGVDALARLVSFLPRLAAVLLRPLGNGLVQFYALGMVLGLAVFVSIVVFHLFR